MRTADEWRQYAIDNIKYGYVPGGDITEFYDHGVRLRQYIEKRAGINFKNKHVLDLGCGNGRLAMALSDVEGIRYTGIDIVYGSIQFAAKAFRDYKNFRFFHSAVANDRYAPTQAVSADKYCLPLDLESIHVVVANSFFTHTGDRVTAQHYLNQIHDVLRDDGILYSTWLSFPPHKRSSDHAKTVYKKGDIINMIEQRFEIVKDWGGKKQSNRDQWRILAKKIPGQIANPS